MEKQIKTKHEKEINALTAMSFVGGAATTLIWLYFWLNRMPKFKVGAFLNDRGVMSFEWGPLTGFYVPGASLVNTYVLGKYQLAISELVRDGKRVISYGVALRSTPDKLLQSGTLPIPEGWVDKITTPVNGLL